MESVPEYSITDGIGMFNVNVIIFKLDFDHVTAVSIWVYCSNRSNFNEVTCMQKYKL